jgi:hypothetical protein
MPKPSYTLTTVNQHCVWCNAERNDGRSCSPFDPLAVRWDLVGACMLYTGLLMPQMETRIRKTPTWQLWTLENAKSDCPMPPSLDSFNDSAYFHALRQALQEAEL